MKKIILALSVLASLASLNALAEDHRVEQEKKEKPAEE
jgi:hypothetical protein